MSLSNYMVRLLSVAEQDLQNIISFVAADKVSAAMALADRIERDLQQLGRHPHLGKIPSDERLTGLGYRILVIENYLVFYKIRGKSVLVYRILHGARDIPSLFEDV